MVLKEETADVVSFRESAHGEQMPRVQGAGRGEEKGDVRGGWESGRCERSWCRWQRRVRPGQANATSGLTGTRACLVFSVRILQRH